VIHRSEIVQQGLLNILKTICDHECVLLDTPNLLKNYSSIHGTKLIFLVDSELDQKEFSGYLEPMSSANDTIILLIREQSDQKVCDDGCNCCFNLTDSKSRIEELIKPHILKEYAAVDKKSSIQLTEREVEVVKLVALGKTNKEMAEQLFISIHTVISHRKNITEKLGIKSISGLTVYAILNNLIDTNSIDIESLI